MADWQLNRIGAKANAPQAVGNPSGYVWESDKSQHVVYRGTDNQIHEVYFKRDGRNQDWRYGGPLGFNINAPLAAGDPVGFAWEGDKTQHIVYRGNDNLIYEVFYKLDATHKGWEYGGPLSAKLGVDGQIHEVFYKVDAQHKGGE